MKEIAKLNSAHNVKNTIIKFIFIKISNVAHTARNNIIQQNAFIKRMF